MVLLYPMIAEAAETPLTLEQAIESGLSEAPQVLAQEVGLEAARSLAVSAGRLPDPELVLGIDNLPVTGSDAYSTTRDFMTMRKVGVMQEFPRRAKRRLQRERAAAETELAEAQLVPTRLAIAREITEAWIRRASSEAALEHLQELQPEIELQAAAARAAVASGRASSADALAAEGAVAELANRILKVQSAA
ncbi:MAG: TolC family protein, partial [Steroidobacteraceae bacterium]